MMDYFFRGQSLLSNLVVRGLSLLLNLVFRGLSLLLNLGLIFAAAIVLQCCFASATNETGRTRKLVNSRTESPPLQATNVQVDVHNDYNLTLAITLPIGAVILSVIGWAIYRIFNRRPIQQAEEAEVVADNPPTKEAEDAVAVTLNVTAQ